MLKNDLFLKALRQEPVSRTPLWLMRQAGRYLPEYRQTRLKAGSFLKLCQTPDLACEVALQPLRRYRLDAAIVFSDILVLPDAMGLKLNFIEGSGPVFENPLLDEKAARALRRIEPEEDLSYVLESIRLLKQELAGKVPLIGFCGSPFTLACYMIDGKGGGDFLKTRTMMFEREDLFKKILSMTAHNIEKFLTAQINYGSEAIMIFDTWGGLLSREKYMDCSLSFSERIIQQLKKKFPEVPVILFTKGGGQYLDMMSQVGCDALGVDWMTSLSEAAKLTGGKVALQGNMDPAVLYADQNIIQHEVRHIIHEYGPQTGHVFNLGHGITQWTPPENVDFLIESVEEESKKIFKSS